MLGDALGVPPLSLGLVRRSLRLVRGDPSRLSSRPLAVGARCEQRLAPSPFGRNVMFWHERKADRWTDEDAE